MVKLASVREFRLYGPRLTRRRSEYMNAGLYVFSTVVLLLGFLAQFSSQPKSALVLLLIASALLMLVNFHDLLAHLAGIDYRLPLIEFDTQLSLVEFAVPILQALGCVLTFLGFLFLFIQEEKGHDYHHQLERHALNLLIAGPVLWLIGSIHNSCQIYERSDGQIQILQECVQIPLLMGCVLFVVGVSINSLEQSGSGHHGVDLLGLSFVWLGVCGSLLFFIGGLANVVKVFKMQQTERLEKLRGGAHEWLIRAREGQAPLIIGEHRRRKMQMPEPKLPVTTTADTPYKDVLVGHS